MEPRFQSSFIPKAPITPNAGPHDTTVKQPGVKRTRTLMGVIGKLIFTLTILAAVGVFGYRFYLNYRIENMGVELTNARAELDPDTIEELLDLNDRLNVAQSLISRHQTLSTLFTYLEESTQPSVGLVSFEYMNTKEGLELLIRGEAEGYAALAAQADLWGENTSLREQTFSDLILNERGNVVFSFKALVDPSFVSYSKLIESEGATLDLELGTSSPDLPTN